MWLRLFGEPLGRCWHGLLCQRLAHEPLGCRCADLSAAAHELVSTTHSCSVVGKTFYLDEKNSEILTAPQVLHNWREHGRRERGSCPQLLRKRALRRECDAGSPVVDTIAAEAFTAASFPLRRARYRSRSAQNPLFGVISSPEGASRTESRREPAFRRRFLAGGKAPYATAAKTSLPAPLRPSPGASKPSPSPPCS